MTPGEFLKNKRKVKGLSLRQMAYKTNLSHTYISEIEKGKLKGTLETQEKIFEALDMNEKEKEMFFQILEEEQLPENIKNELKKLKDEIIELKKRLQQCQIPVIHNNQNNIGQQIIGHHVSNVKMDSGESEDLDISDLSPERVEELKRFIKFLKNS